MDQLSDTQLKALMGASLTPEQSAAALGHANGQVQNFISTADNQRNASIGVNTQNDPAMAGVGVGSTPASGPVSFLGGLVKDIGAPFARGAANLVNVGKGIMAGPSTPVPTGPVDLPIYGKTQPIGVGGGSFGADLKDTLAQGTLAASSVVPTEGLAAGLAKKPLAVVSNTVKDYLANRTEKKALQSTIDALYTSPTGKKFTQAASQVVTGQREITPASVFREQGLTPDQQTVNLSTRLKGLGLGKDPVKNADSITNAFQETEGKLQTALQGDPSLQYSADREGLIRNLNTVRNDSPEEFRIKDSSLMIDKVVNFANKIIGTKTPDTIGGLREARVTFDSQAKREFPNAFKPDGTIDAKTPAGYAIQKTRDTINEHLYNTAPNGSEIQNLIGHEADLFRAGQAVMTKASEGNGKKAFQQWIEANPKKAAALGGVGTIVGYHELKNVPLLGDILP